MMEKLDILDEDGNPTGKSELRSVVHATGLWHQVVHVYFYRSTIEGLEILVHLRSKTKDLHPNKWDTRFGGHIISGETLETALTKELLEETGLHIDQHKVHKGPTYNKNNFPNNEHVAVYFYEFNEDLSKLKFNDGEVQEVKWMKNDEITNSMEQKAELWASNIRSFNKIVKEINRYIV